MKDTNKNIFKNQISRLNRDTSDLFFGLYPFSETQISRFIFDNRFDEKSFTGVIFHFDKILNWYFKDISKSDEFFEIFEEEYQKYFVNEVTNTLPLYIFILGKIFSIENDCSISTSSYGYISDFEDTFLINRNEDVIFLAEHLLDLHENDFHLFFSYNEEEIDQILEWEDDCEEVYPDLFLELSNRVYMNDQGFYRELYDEMITQIIFE